MAHEPSIPGSPGWELQLRALYDDPTAQSYLQSPDHRGGNCNTFTRTSINHLLRPSIPGSPGWELQQQHLGDIQRAYQAFNPRITGVGTATPGKQ